MIEQQLLEEIVKLRTQVEKLQAEMLLMRYSLEAQLDAVLAKIPETGVQEVDPLQGDPMMRFNNPKTYDL